MKMFLMFSKKDPVPVVNPEKVKTVCRTCGELRDNTPWAVFEHTALTGHRMFDKALVH
jgi:hypothetical protein